MNPIDPSDDLAQRLFEAARSEPLPAGAERRVVDAVRKAREVRRRAAPVRVVGYALLAAAVLSAIALFARRREPEIAITGEPARPPRLEAPAPAPAPVPETASAAVPPPQVQPSAPSPRPTPPATLADELAVLKQAESALAASDPRTALEALDRYDHVLKGKQMRAEATLLRLEALSRAGKRGAAASLAARFVAQNPESPLVDRARSFLVSAGSVTDGGKP
jgi:hypothetical protein